MPITTHSLTLPGLILIEPRRHGDARGFFMETYNEADFSRAGLPTRFVQDNLSESIMGTVRGLHFQKPPHAQGKLVRVLAGEVFDVAVDIRPHSATYGRWHGEILSAENGRALYIPPGFAHGFCVTSPRALFCYKCTTPYRPDAESGLPWDDPTINIRWPSEARGELLSERDRRWPRFVKESGPTAFGSLDA